MPAAQPPAAPDPSRREQRIRALGRVFGFSAGDYMCRCSECGGTFQGDKRAFHCFPCAAAFEIARARGTHPPGPPAQNELAAKGERPERGSPGTTD